MYSFNSRVRYSELNHIQGTLPCSSIINYFQDCSTFQSEDLNRGLSYLQSNNRVWLLNSWQLQILHPASLGECITIGTWAYDFKGFYGYRNFIIQDPEEQVLAAANSIWVYIDTDTGKPTKIPKDHAGYALEPPFPMEYADRKVEVPKNFIMLPSFIVKKSNIDSYNHVNNGQYIKMAEEYLPDSFLVHSMRVEYRMQAVLGDIIVPHVSEEAGSFKVALANQANIPFAVIEFQGN
ncbi:MAG: thioesterase [Herbinix sp.]|nr:thioesterase [Herbinix sp.]